ncbi:Arm DNA-binding domain-containing protein [Vibrio parahaemolyticus]
MKNNKYPGVYKNENSISMIFSYAGKQIKRTYKILPTRRNLIYVYNEKLKIVESIEKGVFDIDEFYSGRTKNNKIKAKQYTFSDMYNLYRESYGSERSPSTMRGYNQIASQLSQVLDDEPMDNLSPTKLRFILKEKFGNRNNKSLSEMLNVWRRAHEMLTETLDRTRYNTVEYIGLKYSFPEAEPYQRTEIFYIFDILDDFDRISLSLPLSIFTGLRPGELSALAKEDIDLLSSPPKLTVKRSLTEHGVYKLPKSKSSIRTIELSTFAVEVIKRIYELMTERKFDIKYLLSDYKTEINETLTFLFTKENGDKITSPSYLSVYLRKAFRTKLNHTKIKYKPIKRGRESYTTFCLESGATYMSVAKDLGHRNQRVLEEHYSSSKYSESTNITLNAAYKTKYGKTK